MVTTPIPITSLPPVSAPSALPDPGAPPAHRIIIDRVANGYVAQVWYQNLMRAVIAATPAECADLVEQAHWREWEPPPLPSLSDAGPPMNGPAPSRGPRR